MVGELLQPIVELALYAAGKPVVRLFSLGRWDAELRGSERRRKRWFEFSHQRDGKRYLDPEAVMLIGMAFWLTIIAAIVSCWAWWSFA